MKIISIKLKSPKNTNIFSVAVGENEYLFHSDIIVKYGMYVGKEIDNKEFFQLLDESDYIVCLNKAMEYISSKLKTTKQLKDYLYQKGYKTGTINRVIDKLNEYQVLNDNNFANAYIDANCSKLSKRNLQNKLAEKGIKKDISSTLLQDVNDDEVCNKMAEKFMKNKEYTKQNIDKLIRHLQYKGFEWDSISKTLRNFNIED